MISSAHDIPKNSVLKADLCVIGSGPAGLSLALEFKDRSEKVVVLEGGDLMPSEEAQSLYDLEATGLPISQKSRVRVLGGGGRVWNGLWRPHDEIDFQSRSWVPDSGWPITRAALEPYYVRAAQLFHAPLPADYPVTGALDSARLQTACLFRLADQDFDLATTHRSVLKRSKNIHLTVNANVVSLEKNAQGSYVTVARVKTFSGNEFTVTANRFVLACGGIENARLLLGSRVGNENVGKYYMDHPKGIAGRITFSQPVRWPVYWGMRQLRWWRKAGLCVPAAVQEREKILNSFIALEPEVGRLGSLAQKYVGFQPKVTSVRVRNHLEQAPVADNRVILSERKDFFGNPLARVAWSLSVLDQQTMVVFHRIIQAELFTRSLGRFASPLLDHQDFPITGDASHHMGTTRMGSDPRRSAVDADGRLHGVGNVFVAGSSVFPTSGFANPNATIVALAIRLADYLQRT